ncbi:MAG TPA: hypothetical protein VK933_13755 [Longimicrobiales bacterium]|nr:hypothetical protein [Longimicrobiales bacterium]
MTDDHLTCETTPRATRGAVALRLLQLIAGLFGWGLGIALFIRSHLGLGPWDAFHYGVHLQTGMTVGTASIVAGLVIIGANLALRVRPGVATILNMLLIGVFTDLLLPVIPDAASLAVAVTYFAGAIPLVGLASGLYIGAGFGHGPRDGLMMALTLRTGWSVRSIRTLIEMSVLVLGWLMGGTVGIGTIIVTLTIGHSVQWGLRLFDAVPAEENAPARRSFMRRLRRAA